MNDNILGKEYLNTKCVFLIFSQILSATFLVTKRIQRDIIINVLRSSYKVPLRLSNCNETRIFSTDFRTITIKFIKNPFSESRVVPCGRTDIIHTWCVQVLRSPKEAFAAAMQSWRERCEKCVCLQGDYVEK